MSEGMSGRHSPELAESSAGQSSDKQEISREYTASADEMRLIALLRAGDEAAFSALIEQYYGTLLRLAMMYVSSKAIAEEVVQETWVGVLQGLKRFEGRSSLKTWIFRILTNSAKTRALREGRSIPFSSLAEFQDGESEPTVEPERFTASMGEQGHWLSPPHHWDDIPEERVLSQETRAYVQQAVDMLPENQRIVISLRDIEGWDAEETCRYLGISEVNQRVLLHRARGKVRGALEKYFGEE